MAEVLLGALSWGLRRGSCDRACRGLSSGKLGEGRGGVVSASPHYSPTVPPRFSLMVQDKPLRTSWERKLKERQEKKLVRDLVQQLQEAKQKEREVTGCCVWELGRLLLHHPAFW